MNFLTWLQSWYNQQCDGLWEHMEGIKIETLDNPGWCLVINLIDTEYEDREFKSIKELRTENDWIVCKIENGKFTGYGGPLNLEELLKEFHDWVLN
ncbi:immunity 53 family protein [Desulfosporosinus sp. PR]|uniref:immunity 53 family protein n=1 Tax=Candidatus Desulfosporosinus nitrosoreducens TaxID=3401928 RepID=UPI0027E653D4|nr:immunity 53 family protein [Desulfosporosinus sp. PR]MDQ7095867.1 immunity 53 family protein [Desulfosporosinus sp. PR]